MQDLPHKLRSEATQLQISPRAVHMHPQVKNSKSAALPVEQNKNSSTNKEKEQRKKRESNIHETATRVME